MTRAWRALAEPVAARDARWFRGVFGASAVVMAVADWQRSWLLGAEWFHVPAAGFFRLSPQGYSLLQLIGAAGGLSLAFDRAVRLGAASIALVHGWALASDLLLFRNHEYLAALLGLLVTVTSIGSPSVPGGSIAGMGPLLVRGQILIVYFWAVVNKLNAPFLDGWVLEGELGEAFPASVGGHALRAVGFSPDALTDIWKAPSSLPVIASYATVLGEAALLCCLTVPRWRRAGVWVGVALHAGIALTMNVFAFGLMMGSTYFLFATNASCQHPMES